MKKLPFGAENGISVIESIIFFRFCVSAKYRMIHLAHAKASLFLCIFKKTGLWGFENKTINE